MTKKEGTQTLHVSLLPLILIVLLALGAGYFLVGADLKKMLLTDGTEVRRLDEFPKTVPTQEVMDKQRVVIKSQDELERFIRSIDKTGLSDLKEKINFDKEMLIGVSTKTLSTEGNVMKIRKLYKSKDDGKDGLLVSIKQTSPGESCEQVDPQPNVIIDLVAIEKTDMNITFEFLRDEKPCN